MLDSHARRKDPGREEHGQRSDGTTAGLVRRSKPRSPDRLTSHQALGVTTPGPRLVADSGTPIAAALARRQTLGKVTRHATRVQNSMFSNCAWAYSLALRSRSNPPS